MLYANLAPPKLKITRYDHVMVKYITEENLRVQTDKHVDIELTQPGWPVYPNKIDTTKTMNIPERDIETYIADMRAKRFQGTQLRNNLLYCVLILLASGWLLEFLIERHYKRRERAAGKQEDHA